MENLPKISVRRKMHDGWICLFLFFDASKEIADVLEELSAQWSRTYATWYLFEDTFSLHEVFTTFRGRAMVEITDLEPIESFMPISSCSPNVFKISNLKGDIDAIIEQKEYAVSNFVLYLKSLGYRSSTIRNYKYQLKKFLFSCKLGIDDITDQHINDHRSMLKDDGQSSSVISQFRRGMHLFQLYWEKKILFINGREYHRKERKYLPFLSRKILLAICSYLVRAGMN